MVSDNTSGRREESPHVNGANDSDISIVGGPAPKSDGVRADGGRKTRRPGRRPSVSDSADDGQPPAGSAVERLLQDALKRRIPEPDDPECEHAFPNLWEFLTLDQYAGGLERILGEITIVRIPGGYRATIKDHDTGKAKSASSLTLLDCFRGLEEALCDPNCPWIDFKSYKNKKGLDKFKDKDA